MTTKQQKSFIRKLNELADIAEREGLLLPNGAMVDGLLGSMASDLEVEVFPKMNGGGE